MTRLATDAGGAFTDLVAFDALTGRIVVGKALTTPRDPSLGVIDALHQVVASGVSSDAVAFFVHGGTTVINAITERKGVPTTRVTTRGFRDVLAIGRATAPISTTSRPSRRRRSCRATCASRSPGAPMPRGGN